MSSKKHMIDILFIVILTGAFAISAIILVVLGSNVYKETVSSNREAYDLRTSSLYFYEKIRQADSKDQIRIDTLKTGTPALVLSQKKGQQAYASETWIFLSDGQLREATVKEGMPITHKFGQPVLTLKQLEFIVISPHLLQIQSTSEGGTRSKTNINIKNSVLEVQHEASSI